MSICYLWICSDGSVYIYKWNIPNQAPAPISELDLSENEYAPGFDVGNEVSEASELNSERNPVEQTEHLRSQEGELGILLAEKIWMALLPHVGHLGASSVSTEISITFTAHDA